MRGSRNFCQGGGGSRLRRFLVLNLFYRGGGGGLWFYCRENYTFPRIQRGSNIFRGGPSKGDLNANCYHNNFLSHAVATMIHGCKQTLFLEHAQILYLKKYYMRKKKNPACGNRSLDPYLVKLQRYHLSYLGKYR